MGLALGSVNGAFNLDVALSALESSGNGRLLSTPRVTTQNNIAAEITQGVQIPIQTVANNTVTVTFKDAALTLQGDAADHRGGHGHHADRRRERARRTSPRGRTASRRSTPSAPTPACWSATAQTTVIGGIYVSNQQNQNDRTPGLSRDSAARSGCSSAMRVNDTSTELLIFITPRIIKS